MNTMQLRDAKANLSKLVAAAERGEATTITKHGKPVAVVVPVGAVAAREMLDLESPKKNFAEFLMTFPVDMREVLPESERPRVRDVDLF